MTTEIAYMQLVLLLSLLQHDIDSLNCALNALILALNDSAAALVALLSKKVSPR